MPIKFSLVLLWKCMNLKAEMNRCFTSFILPSCSSFGLSHQTWRNVVPFYPKIKPKQTADLQTLWAALGDSCLEVHREVRGQTRRRRCCCWFTPFSLEKMLTFLYHLHLNVKVGFGPSSPPNTSHRRRRQFLPDPPPL